MTMRQAIAEALAGLEIGSVLYDEPMSHHASLRLGGPADALVAADDEAQLAAVVRRLTQKGIAFLPVGNLTNILVRDGGYRGALLWMRGWDQTAVSSGPDGTYFLDAQAGAALGRVVALAAAEALAGVEFCTGIPGSVGGAVRMNAGAYGKEIKDVVSRVTVMDKEGRVHQLRREDIAFAYRRSGLPADSIICRARFVLTRGDAGRIRARMNEIREWRQEKHPLQYPSAGSVFKNPPGEPAGRLIEELGLKGRRLGDVQISKKHANFMVNKGQGTAADMLELIRLVQETVRREKGVTLEPEIVIIGEER